MGFETILDAYAKACEEEGVHRHYGITPNLHPQRDAFRALLELIYEKAYYHGVNVGLEVADPQLFGEDHVALS